MSVDIATLEFRVYLTKRQSACCPVGDFVLIVHAQLLDDLLSPSNYIVGVGGNSTGYYLYFSWRIKNHIKIAMNLSMLI